MLYRAQQEDMRNMDCATSWLGSKSPDDDLVSCEGKHRHQSSYTSSEGCCCSHHLGTLKAPRYFNGGNMQKQKFSGKNNLFNALRVPSESANDLGRTSERLSVNNTSKHSRLALYKYLDHVHNLFMCVVLRWTKF